MKCPVCHAELTSKPIKEWVYGSYAVSRYKCPECEEFINLYEAEGRKSFTIPKYIGWNDSEPDLAHS